jgi:3-dehydroquinate synthase
MKPQKLQIKFSRESAKYKIAIKPDSLASAGVFARKCLGDGARKIVVVSNPKVFRLYGDTVVRSLAEAGFEVSHFLMRDGEKYKDLNSAEGALSAFAEVGLARTDAVVALGGGVVGDLAGFASAVYLRGISFLQIPTTLLAMVDSSVGGKTGVNSDFGKNLIGAFHQPSGVLIDPTVLATLPRRELTAGFCEMIKQGAVGGGSLLGQTDKFLSDHGSRSFRPHGEDKNFQSQIAYLISSHIAFKAKIVAGDERESQGRTDPRSRKILNFGHTLAHALEKATNYSYFRHGEAVGHGILFAAELSKSLALCGEKDVNLLNDVVHRAGSLPGLAGIGLNEVFEAFSFDKKNIAGSLQMVLLRGIGKPVILTGNDIPRPLIRKVLRKFLQNQT